MILPFERRKWTLAEVVEWRLERDLEEFRAEHPDVTEEELDEVRRRSRDLLLMIGRRSDFTEAKF